MPRMCVEFVSISRLELSAVNNDTASDLIRQGVCALSIAYARLQLNLPGYPDCPDIHSRIDIAGRWAFRAPVCNIENPGYPGKHGIVSSGNNLTFYDPSIRGTCIGTSWQGACDIEAVDGSKKMSMLLLHDTRPVQQHMPRSQQLPSSASPFPRIPQRLCGGGGPAADGQGVCRRED